MPSLTRTKSIAELISASEAHSGRLRRHLGPVEPGRARHRLGHRRGIFTLTGTAAAGLQFDFSSIYKAPVLDLLMHGGNAVGTHGPAGRGSGDFAFVPAGRDRLRIRGAVLRRAGLHDPGGGQRLHLRLRDHGRDFRLDHRLGPDPRIRRLEHGRGGGILGVLERPAGKRHSAFICPNRSRIRFSSKASPPARFSTCRRLC